MHSMESYFGTIYIFCGAIFVLLSIPLVAGKVPRNRLYGFRFPKAYASEKNWYEINRYGGRQLLRWSVFLILIGLLYFIFPIPEPRNPALDAVIAVAPIMICTGAAIFKTWTYAKTLQG